MVQSGHTATRLPAVVMEDFVPARLLERCVDKKTVASLGPSHPSKKMLASLNRKKVVWLSLPDT
jgi:hypothetical protein